MQPRFEPEPLLEAILAGGTPPAPTTEAESRAFLDATAHHGVDALVAHRLGPTGLRHWPEPLGRQLASQSAAAAAIDALAQREVEGVLEALAGGGVKPLLLKGTPLAYSIYESPALRPRFDTDLLVRRQDMNSVVRVMSGLGYRRPRQVTGELVMHQVDFARTDHRGVSHVYDFHWKVANRHVFANVLSFDELDRDALAVPGLGPFARTVDFVHALLLACVHRVAHHREHERLIWLYDIHLLAGRLSREQWRAFGMLATERAMRAVCADGLAAARRCLRTPIPSDVIELLAAPGREEPSEAFLRGSRGPVATLMSDLKALPDWTDRARLLLEHAFPSPTYIAGKYGVSNRAWLPALYTHRILGGALRWLMQSPS